MNERKPVKSLFDLKLTTWFVTRKPIVQEAICKYPPGYYIYTGNAEVYRLIGWSEPEEKLGETVVHIFLEREIEGGTERIRIHPNYITMADTVIEADQQVTQEFTTPIETVTNFESVITGYNVGKEINGEIKYLMFEGQRRVFVNILAAQLFLIENNMATEEQLHDFYYPPIYS